MFGWLSFDAITNQNQALHVLSVYFNYELHSVLGRGTLSMPFLVLIKLLESKSGRLLEKILDNTKLVKYLLMLTKCLFFLSY